MFRFKSFINFLLENALIAGQAFMNKSGIDATSQNELLAVIKNQKRTTTTHNTEKNCYKKNLKEFLKEFQVEIVNGNAWIGAVAPGLQ